MSGVRASLTKFLFQRRKPVEEVYVECNRGNKQTQINQRAGTSRSESAGGIATKPKKAATSGLKRGGWSSAKGGSSKTGNKAIRRSLRRIIRLRRFIINLIDLLVTDVVLLTLFRLCEFGILGHCYCPFVVVVF